MSRIVPIILIALTGPATYFILPSMLKRCRTVNGGFICIVLLAVPFASLTYAITRSYFCAVGTIPCGINIALMALSRKKILSSTIPMYRPNMSCSEREASLLGTAVPAKLAVRVSVDVSQ